MADNIHPLQALVDGMNAAAQKVRAGDQLTLGGLIALLSTLAPERRVVGLSDPASYRGYYCDLAFEPEGDLTVADLLTAAHNCMGKVFEGYKGGEFVMGERTPLWVAPWGSTGAKLMGLNTEADPITPITEEEEW